MTRTAVYIRQGPPQKLKGGGDALQHRGVGRDPYKKYDARIRALTLPPRRVIDLMRTASINQLLTLEGPDAGTIRASRILCHCFFVPKITNQTQ